MLSENEIAPLESVIAPLLIFTLPISADVFADKVVVDTFIAFNSPLLLYTAALPLVTLPASIPLSKSISFEVTDTPLRIFNSSAVDETFVILLIALAAPVARSVFSKLMLVAVSLPVTLTALLISNDSALRVTNPVLLTWPMVLLSTITCPTDNVPAVNPLVPILISPNNPPIEPLVNAPTVVIVPVPVTGAYNVSASVVDNLELIKVLTSEGTLASKLSLDESTVKPDNLLISDPVAVTDVLFNTIAAASTVPLTSNLPLDNVNKSASRLVPTVEPLILISPISPVVDVILPLVVMSPDVSTVIAPPIEPLVNAPTVTIVFLPAIGAYVIWASLDANLESNCVWMSEDTLLTKFSFSWVAVNPSSLLISAVVAVTPSIILISSAEAVTATLLSFISDAWRVPFILNKLLFNSSKSLSSSWPILFAEISMLPIFNVLPDIVLSPTSILPNPDAIEPDVNAPTVVIVDAPEVSEIGA